MKKIIIIAILGFIFFSSRAQSLIDTKDFITEKIEANNSLLNYSNKVLFGNQISKEFLGEYLNLFLSDMEYNNLFLYLTEVYYTNNKYKLAWIKTQIIDLRGITKITTTNMKEYNRDICIITIYMNSGYLSMESVFVLDKIEHENKNKMEIFIENNGDVALKLKKAIIHLGTLIGVNIKDGDIF